MPPYVHPQFDLPVPCQLMFDALSLARNVTFSTYTFGLYWPCQEKRCLWACEGDADANSASLIWSGAVLSACAWRQHFAWLDTVHLQNQCFSVDCISGCTLWPGPEVIKPFSCSTQMSMKFFMLIDLKILTIANPFLLNIAEHEIFSANKIWKCQLLLAFSYLLAEKISCLAELSMKKFNNLGARSSLSISLLKSSFFLTGRIIINFEQTYISHWYHSSEIMTS